MFRQDLRLETAVTVAWDGDFDLSEEAIQQEIYINWSATRGKRVYPEYGPIHLAKDPLRYDPTQTLYCGWDFGAHFGGTPAWVPTQLNSFGQWLIFPPIAPVEEYSIGTYEFGQQVADHLQREYAQPFGKKWRDLKILHFGDPNGAQRPPRTGDKPREMVSHFQLLDKGTKVMLGFDDYGGEISQRLPGFGFKIQPGPVNVADRVGAVRARLKLILSGGLPALVVDPRATVIKDGFAGGYHHERLADGNYSDKPEKNWYSHAFDALAYIAACLFVVPEDLDERSEGIPAARRFRCQAAGRLGAAA